MIRTRFLNNLIHRAGASRVALFGAAVLSLLSTNASTAWADVGVEKPADGASSTNRIPRLDTLTTYLGQSIYGSARIPVRQQLGINSYYQDRALEMVYVEYYPDASSNLLLLLDGRPLGRPQTVNAYDGGYIFFRLPERRNYVGRNFNTIQIQIQGYGFVGELGAEFGEYYDGDRPQPPYPPYPPYPYPPFPPLPPGPIHPLP